MRALGQPWELAVFLWIPLILFGVLVVSELHLAGSLKDWEIFRSASHSVVHGRSPFPPATSAALAHGDTYVYPPITALLLTPLAFLPVVAGKALFLLLALGCLLLALRLLGVRDWRCYGLAAPHRPGGRHSEPRRDQLDAAPRRRAGLALPRSPRMSPAR